MNAAITVTHNAGPWTYILASTEEATEIAARLRQIGYPVTGPVPTERPVTGMTRTRVTTIYA